MIPAALLTLILTAATVMPPATQNVFLARFEQQYEHAVDPVFVRRKRVDPLISSGWTIGSTEEERVARNLVALERACATTTARLRALHAPMGFSAADTQQITQWIEARRKTYRARCATVPAMIAWTEAPPGRAAVAEERMRQSAQREQRADKDTPAKATRLVWKRAGRAWPKTWV